MKRYLSLAVIMLACQVPAEAADIEAGKVVYDAVCAYCHRSDYDDKFGPGLAGIKDRVSDEWLDAFLQDPDQMIKTDDYAKTLRESNTWGITMPKIPEMQKPDARANVIEYLKTLE